MTQNQAIQIVVRAAEAQSNGHEHCMAILQACEIVRAINRPAPTPEYCAACGAISEGNFSIHRDGFEVGPEVPLCDACGSEVKPTLPDLWERIRARLVDYQCSDCQDWFRSEQTPVHAPATGCPKCKGENTYEADTE